MIDPFVSIGLVGKCTVIGFNFIESLLFQASFLLFLEIFGSSIPFIFSPTLSVSPNSCGQVQVADIGIMGGPARKEVNGKMMAVQGCKIFVGGRIGEDAHLSMDPVMEGIPLDEEDLIPALVKILKDEFGAVDKK